jgi:hypothetical protein
VAGARDAGESWLAGQVGVTKIIKKRCAPMAFSLIV